MEFVLRVCMSTSDAHYGGNLVDGARIMGLFGDAATALLVYTDGDEGLFLAYEEVLFKARSTGDFWKSLPGWKVGHTSRTMSFEAYKIIAGNPAAGDSAADQLPVGGQCQRCVLFPKTNRERCLDG